jgi:hypothetical protein
MDLTLQKGESQAVYSVQQDVRVFICGVNVTPLVQSVAITLSPFLQGGNTCTITLQNFNDVLTISESNLNGVFNTPSYDPNISSSHTPYPWQQEFDESIKKYVLQHKIEVQIVKTPTGESLYDLIQKGLKLTEASGKPVKSNSVLWKLFPEDDPDIAPTRWDLYPGGCIFNTNDPVRVFLRHPTDQTQSSTTSKEEPVWYHGFTGYLTTVSEADQLGAGVYSIVLTAEGAATRMLRLSRVAKNHSAYLDAIAQFPELVVGDILDPTSFTSIFISLSMPQILGALVVGGGATVLNQYGPPLPPLITKVQGIGRFSIGQSPGGIQLWDPSKFDIWQQTIHPKLTEAEVLTIGASSGFGDPSKVYESFGGFSGDTAPDRGLLHMMLPNKSFAHYTQVVEQSFISPEVATATEWDNRLDIIKKYICTYMWYQVQETPKGDVVAEFPMFDFTPYDLGSYGKSSLINDSQTESVAFSEDDNKAYTWITVTGSLTTVEAVNQSVDETLRNVWYVAHGILVNLIPRYGIRVLPVYNPLLRDDESRIYFLKVVAAKAVADIRSAHSTIGVSDPSIICNRPYLLSYKNILGLLLRVEHSIQYQSSATCSLDMNYVRLAQPEGNNQYKFMIIGGDDRAAKPLAYQVLTNVTGAFSDKTTATGPQGAPDVLPPTPVAKDGNTSTQNPPAAPQGQISKPSPPQTDEPNPLPPEVLLKGLF